MKTLGKYQLLEVLRTGSMSVIYRARDPVLDREVALKAISTAAIDPESKERFYREARSCARLQHPQIVTIYDLGEQDDTAYIAMELLSGADLRRVIEEKRPFPLEAKLELLAEVCDGLAHAHRNGIVHRDIKPGNIFLQDDGQAKILDFGIARLPASKLTRVGSALGTREYMAPEQIAGKPCEARSDLFSVAIVLFEFLTYQHPFGGANSAGRIVSGQPESLRGIDPLLPASLDPILAMGLSKAVDGRYPKAEAFASALRGVREEAGLSAVAARNEVESLRRAIMAGKSKLGQFEQCQRVQVILAQPGLDWSAIEAPDPPEGGYLGWHYLRARLGKLREGQEKTLELTRQSRERLRSIRGLLKDGRVDEAREALALLEADFPDHPHLATLRKRIARPPVVKKAAAAAPPEPTDRAATTLQRLLHALEEQDRSVLAETADRLRVLLQEAMLLDPPDLRSRCEQALLDADFELARVRCAERLAAGEVSSAQEAVRQLETLPLKAHHQVEARDQFRRQLEEAHREQDPTERRAAEFQNGLEEFHAALEKRDIPMARDKFDRIKRLAAEDERFRVTRNECEKRLRELEGSAEAPQAPAVNPILAALRQRSEQLLEQEDYEQCVAFVDSLGRQHQGDPEIAGYRQRALSELARRSREAPPALEQTPPRPAPAMPRGPFEVPARESQPARPPLPSLVPAAKPLGEVESGVPEQLPLPAVPATEQSAEAAPEAAPVEEAPAQEMPPPALSPPPSFKEPLPTLRIPVARAEGLTKAQKAIIGSLAAVVLVVAAVILFSVGARRPVPLAAAQATAEVITAETRILASPGPGAHALVTLRKGERVNVLRAPAERKVEWIEVQFVSGNKLFPSGYVKLAALGNWSSENPGTALALLKLFGPEASASESEIRQQVGKLAEFTARFGITPQGPQANFEMSKWNLILARRAKEKNQPPENWQSYLDAATGQLAMAAVAAELAGPVAKARQDLEALKEAERPRPRTPAASARRPDTELKRAEEAWRRGRYREALRTLDRLLRERPGYTPALVLREKVRRAQQLESRTR